MVFSLICLYVEASRRFFSRVIITGRHGTTKNIAEFVEKELSENVSNLPSFIKESTDFLNRLFTTLTQLCKLFSP
jgi:flavodoxin